MGYAVLKSTAPFTLHLRCDNCMRESTRDIELPVGDDIPRDADELIESAFLGSLKFNCRPCGGVIGRLIGIEGGNPYGY
ncbi:hypothetical protein AKG11_05070 [Shinella sp. SUS2]|uniref:hypothetical protein n=1 Tax=unclassified Shinella TaxID=2643062 RepID=UPI0006809694|nr:MULTISPECIES: hypothetical protein [unclassified Shinella]KNY18487.1 hypothetical protein AKG11_05070 [Shinella sp. SUS2]KOC71800.1 hypothetical protein AKG10_30870 [Shinella sp. GWS1]